MAIPVVPKDRTTFKTQVVEEPKKKGWVTPYGFIDAKKPITYNQAMQIGAELQDRLKDIESENNG